MHYLTSIYHPVKSHTSVRSVNWWMKNKIMYDTFFHQNLTFQEVSHWDDIEHSKEMPAGARILNSGFTTAVKYTDMNSYWCIYTLLMHAPWQSRSSILSWFNLTEPLGCRQSPINSCLLLACNHSSNHCRSQSQITGSLTYLYKQYHLALNSPLLYYEWHVANVC